MLTESLFQDNAALLYHLLQKDPLKVNLPAHGVLITDEAYCQTIRAHLLQQVSVQQIDLSGSRLASLGLHCLVEALESGCGQQLAVLRLRDTRLPAFKMPGFLRLLGTHAPLLAELDIGGNQLADEVAADVAAFVRPGLTTLSIADNQFTDAAIQQVVNALVEKKVSSLVSLNLSGNRLGLRTCTALGQYLSSVDGGQLSLLELCVRHARLDDSTAQPLAEGIHVSSLQFLDIAENDCAATFSSRSAESPVSFPHTLCTLDFSHNKIVAALVAGLCANLRACAESLEDLYLTGCFNGDAQVARLVAELGEAPHLRRLSLADAAMSSRGGSTLSHLLTRLTVLERLDASGNLFDVDGAAHLAEGLQRLTYLEALTLASCRLGDSGATVVVASLLRAGCPLAELDLSFNHISDGGVRELCALLSRPESPKLQLLLLSGNPCTVHARTDLELMLNTHQTECTVVARDTDLEAVGEATESRHGSGSQNTSMHASLTVDMRGG